jgi:hypothetical protein
MRVRKQIGTGRGRAARTQIWVERCREEAQ